MRNDSPYRDAEPIFADIYQHTLRLGIKDPCPVRFKYRYEHMSFAPQLELMRRYIFFSAGRLCLLPAEAKDAMTRFEDRHPDNANINCWMPWCPKHYAVDNFGFLSVFCESFYPGSLRTLPPEEDRPAGAFLVAIFTEDDVTFDYATV